MLNQFSVLLFNNSVYYSLIIYWIRNIRYIELLIINMKWVIDIVLLKYI